MLEVLEVLVSVGKEAVAHDVTANLPNDRQQTE